MEEDPNSVHVVSHGVGGTPQLFFTQMRHSFVGAQLHRVDDEMEIPTEPFLLASGDFLPILDKLGSKARMRNRVQLSPSNKETRSA